MQPPKQAVIDAMRTDVEWLKRHPLYSSTADVKMRSEAQGKFNLLHARIMDTAKQRLERYTKSGAIV